MFAFRHEGLARACNETLDVKEAVKEGLNNSWVFDPATFADKELTSMGAYLQEWFDAIEIKTRQKVAGPSWSKKNSYRPNFEFA